VRVNRVVGVPKLFRNLFMRITKIVNKTLNLDRIMQELKPLGVSRLGFVGFRSESAGVITLEVPFATRSEYGSTSRDGVRTPKMADPGELRLEMVSDPGRVLDDALDAHDFRTLSTGQQTAADREVDAVSIKAELDGGNPLSKEGVKALARLVLHKYGIRR